MNRPPSFVWSKLALISVSSAYSTKAEPKKRRFCCCPCLPVLGWLWRLICWAFGETGRKAALYCRFLFVPSLFSLLSSSFCLRLSLVAYSAALLALWLWLDLCGSSGAGCLLAVVSLLSSCWLWLSCRSASGFDFWAALPLVLSPSLRPCPLLGLALRPLRCCLGVSRRSRVQCCGSSGAGAGRRCRPKGYGRMHNSVRLYLYDMPLAYCTKR